MLEAEKEDTNGEIDFLGIRCDISFSEKLPDIGPKLDKESKAASIKKSRKSHLEDMVDNCINNLQEENNVRGEDIKVKKALQNNKRKTWLNQKAKARKTYGKQSKEDYIDDDELSPALTGEELSGDNTFARKGKLPLVSVDTADDKVGKWLDMSSQPTASQSSVSTPNRNYSKPINVPDVSPFPLSPLDLNITKKIDKRNTGPVKITGVKPVNDKSIDDTIPFTQTVPNSCPVEINDTFDKLLSAGKNMKTANAAASEVDKEQYEFLCSQKSDISMSGFISPEASKKIIEALESSNDEWLSDQHHVSKPNRGLDVEKLNKSSSGGKGVGVGDSSVEDCLGWNSQEACQGKQVSDKYDKLVELHSKDDKVFQNQLSSEKKTKVQFSLVGKIAPAAKRKREKVATFLQLGCLASPSIKKFNLPSRKEIIARSLMNSMKQEKKLFDFEDGNVVSGIRKTGELTNKSNADTPVNSEKKTNISSSVLKNHLKNHIENLSSDNQGQCMSNKTTYKVFDQDLNSSAVGCSVPEDDLCWDINKSEVDESGEFMKQLLGEGSKVYSQDKETELEVIQRVARIEFEEEMMIESKKRARSESIDDSFDIEVDESPLKKEKKTLKIDSEETQEACISGTPERPGSRSKIKSIVARRRSRNSGDHQTIIKNTHDILGGDSELHSKSLLDSPMSKSLVSRSSNSVTSDDQDRITTQEIQKQLEDAEDKSKYLKKEAALMAKVDTKATVKEDSNTTCLEKDSEKYSDVEPMFDDEVSHFLEKETIQPLLPSTADLVLDTETMDVEQNFDQTRVIPETEMIVSKETRVIPDSDDDMFDQTPERPSQIVAPSCPPQLSPVVEHEEVPDTSNWTFVLSNLSVSNKKIATEFINNLNCKGISNKVDSNVTHLIVSTGENLEAQRTLKFLQAVSSGVMIVSFRWIEACIKDESQLGKAENWEALDEELEGANGPFRSRKSREEGNKPLLAGFEVLIEGQLEGLDKSNINDLLSRVGARSVPTLNLFSCTAGVTRLIIVNSTATYGAKNVTKMLRSYRVAVVDKDWMLDSVSSHSVRSLLPYTVETIQQSDLVRAGYKGHLVQID